MNATNHRKVVVVDVDNAKVVLMKRRYRLGKNCQLRAMPARVRPCFVMDQHFAQNTA